VTGPATHAEDRPELAAKVERLALRHAALREEVQRAQAAEALTRSRLSQALADALLALARAEADGRIAAAKAYRAAAEPSIRHRRRNRIKRRLDRALVRLRSVGGALVIARSGLWARAGGGVSAMAAYARRGADPMAQPAALLDQAWYLAANPDVATGRLAPLVHYISSGWAEGRSPHPLFDRDFYAARNAEALAATGLSPLEHFVHLGAAQGRDPHPLFSIDHYVAQAPELSQTGENPLAHYLREGWRRDLSPHPLFQAARYRGRLTEAEAQLPALVHYVTVGSARGLKPHRLFDPAWYRDQYPDVVAAGFEALSHYVIVGGHEGRNPGPWFDAARYMALRGDELRAEVDPLTDYLQGGAWTVAQPLVSETADPRLTPLENWASLSDDA
jgi:hypothetical protein